MTRNLQFYFTKQISRIRFAAFFAAFALFSGTLPLFSQSAEFYWEKSAAISAKDSVYPKTTTVNGSTCVFWQEVDRKKQQIYLTACFQGTDGQWTSTRRFAGPFDYYGGEIPDLYTVASAPGGKIAVAVQASETLIQVFVSSDSARSFTHTDIPVKSGEFFAPRIYCLKNGRFILFVSCAKVSNPQLRLHDFYIYQSVSEDGRTWPAFTETFADGAMVNSFAPFLCNFGQSDFVAFQTRTKNTYQLYASHSENGGRSWSTPVILTDSKSVEKNISPEDYDNQGPFLFAFGGALHLAWERRLAGRESSEIWYEKIDASGAVPGSFGIIADDANSRRASLFSYKDELYAAWFENRSGVDSVYCARQIPGSVTGWSRVPLESGSLSKSFPAAAVSGGRLYFLWQEQDSKSGTSIKLLSPDTTVAKPVIVPERYSPGSRTKQKSVTYRLRFPEDASGIEGYVYSWSRSAEAVPNVGAKLSSVNRATVNLRAEEEGSWYFTARIKDKAGNWSEPVSSVYSLDLTPPHKVSFLPLATDGMGFMQKNSFVLQWQASSTDDDVTGFVHSRLERIAGISSRYNSVQGVRPRFTEEDLSSYAASLKERYASAVNKKYALNSRVQSVPSFSSSANLTNGVYAFSVAAVDSAGNIGDAETVLILLNKYVPRVRITEVSKSVSSFGDVSVELFGTDFTYAGTVRSVFIDKDGIAPYDMVIQGTDGQLKISDGRISGINLGRDMEEGAYYVGLVHSLAGTVRTQKPALYIDVNGTVKIDTAYEYVPDWKRVTQKYVHSVSVAWAVLVLIIAFSAVALVVFGVSIIRNISEMIFSRSIIQKLKQGTLMQEYSKQTTEKDAQRKGSLKTSLAGFTIALVVLIIAIISLILGVSMIRENEENLSTGLRSRVNVLLTSISTGARTYLQTEETFELNQLLNQASSVEETEFVTITGMKNSGFADSAASAQSGTSESKSLLYVWASNDAEIASKVNVLNSRGMFTPGVSMLEKDVPAELFANDACIALNELVRSSCDPLSIEISNLNRERQSATAERRSQIDARIQELNISLQNYMQSAAEQAIGSVPQFNDKRLDRSVSEYIFYRPVLFRNGSSSEYVRGIVFVKVSTTELIREINNATIRILVTVFLISVVAIVFGIVAAMLFANRIVSPIQLLEKTVTEISEENDKERLLAGDITDLPNNEIGRLGDSVNRMKKDLGYNARELNLQANDATPIQQSMIALEPLSGNFKQNVSDISDANVSEFAYYKGASGASGDYFDFKKLDDRWYVLIKCDASGHAAPAGILVTMVATLYKKYFETWKPSKGAQNLDDFVYKVNDFLESLNIKGKFVAFIICLFDSKTGTLYMSHAGDRLVRIFDSSTRTLKKLELTETPAAGPFPSFMLQMKGGFKTEQAVLNKNDILLLYTDGIEENGRVLRTPDFAAVRKPKLDKDGNQISDEYGNLQFEDEKEEFGEERIKEITNAVLNRKKYVLKKKSDPAADVLEFDFSNCQGTTKELIMALSSAEKLFRLYKPTSATVKDLTEVDRSIDAFLKEHLSVYSVYAVPPTEQSFGGQEIRTPKNPNNVFYAFAKEDIQDDDLTIVALQRK